MDNGWQHKEQNTDTFYHNDGPQKHDAKEKKPDIKDYILYSSIDRGCSEKANLQRQKDKWLPAVGVGMRVNAKRHESTFGGRIILKLDCGDGSQLRECIQNHWMVHFLRYLSYTLIKPLKFTFGKMGSCCFTNIFNQYSLWKPIWWQWNWILKKNGKKQNTHMILARTNKNNNEVWGLTA